MSKLKDFIDGVTLVASFCLIVLGMLWALDGQYDRATFDVALAIFGWVVAKS